MNSRYALHPEALADLDEIHEYIAEQSADFCEAYSRYALAMGRQ